MQMAMKPNLYAILDMIPEISTNKSIQWLKQHLKRSPTPTIRSKMVQTIGKGVKIFKNLKNFYK